MSKRSRGSASKGEPIPKKARRESEAEALMPKVVPLGIEVQGEEEEEEEEAPILRSRGLRSRGPVILKRENSQMNPSWPTRSSDLKLIWWGGMALRLRESRPNLNILQLMGEGGGAAAWVSQCIDVRLAGYCTQPYYWGT